MLEIKKKTVGPEKWYVKNGYFYSDYDPFSLDSTVSNTFLLRDIPNPHQLVLELSFSVHGGTFYSQNRVLTCPSAQFLHRFFFW